MVNILEMIYRTLNCFFKRNGSLGDHKVIWHQLSFIFASVKDNVG